MMNTQSMMGQMPPESVPGVAQPGPPIDQAQLPMDPTGGMAEPESEEEQLGDFVDFALSESNLAKKYKDKEDDQGNILDRMGAEIYQGYMDDEDSRTDWMERNREWLDLALLVRQNKTFPWPGASNIKYPLVATAAMQFSARAYPALVPADGKVVKAKVVARDKQGIWQQKALRVAMHMSSQIMHQIPNWEEDMDKLLMTMAISGVCFKKTYHDSLMGKHVSQLVYPENLCINYWAKSIEKAYRKTEVLHYNENELRARINNDEEFLDLDYPKPVIDDTTEKKKAIMAKDEPSQVDKSTPHTFLACHTYWDLDEDGYEEPYIITVHKESRKVARIIARWDSDGVTKSGKKVVHIKPVEYFTDFPFIPNPDGSIYALGFGSLLAPLNESANTLINQLVDAGTLNNLSGGFIGKSLRIKMGQLQIRPGQWQVVNATGEDMQKSFYPLPTKEPSAVLFQLLNMLVTSGNQLASIAEIFVGKMPGQNTPATTTQETIQQGMAVFTAIYKRVYRSLGKEYGKIFRLNRITPGMIDEEIKYAGEPLQASDYDIHTAEYVIPGADPTGDSATMRMAKLQQVGQLLQLQTIDPMVYTKRFLEALEVPNFEEFIPPPQPPQPDPKQQEMQMKMEMEQKKTESKMAMDQQKMEVEKQIAEIKIQLEQAKLEFQQQKQAMDMQGEKMKLEMDMVSQVTNQRMEQRKMQSDLAMTEAKNRQTIQQNEAIGEQKVKQAKQQAKAKPKSESKQK